jgi:hypothetical protein
MIYKILKEINMKKEKKLEIHFDDGSGDKWWYEFTDHNYASNLVNLKNCLFRNTLPENWITKIISNNKTYQSDKDIIKFLGGALYE